MDNYTCRFCNLYFFDATGAEAKVRVTCRRCKRTQVINLATDGKKNGLPSHLQAAGLR